MLLLSSCWSKGDTEVKLSGNENLPEEIRGLRVYRVNIDNLNRVYVGVLKGHETTSLTYPDGKTESTLILVTDKKRNSPQRVVFYKELIMENDSILIIRK